MICTNIQYIVLEMIIGPMLALLSKVSSLTQRQVRKKVVEPFQFGRCFSSYLLGEKEDGIFSAKEDGNSTLLH